MRAIACLMLLAAMPGATLNAQTFLTTPVNLSATGSGSMPAIAVGLGGDIDVAWRDSGAILFKRSVDGGQTFSATMAVATTNPASQASQPQIAVNSAGVYVAWAGTNSGGGGDIFFSSLTNGSSSWLSPVNVSATRGIASGSSAPVPHMTVDPNGGVDIVWGQNGAWFWRSRDGLSVRLTASAMASQSPRIAIDSLGHIFVVWENAASCPTITVGRSTDGGATFTPYSVADNVTVTGQPVSGCTSDVQIAVRPNNTVWLLWANENPNIQDLIITYAVDTDPFTQSPSTSFPEAQFENLSGTASHTPQMTIDLSGNISVVWIGDINVNNPQEVVYFSRSTDPQKGGTFCGGPNNANCRTPPILSASGANPAFPQIAAESSGAIDVVWQQASATNPSGAFDIVLAHSTDGVSFTITMLNSVSTTQSGTAQIAADSSGSVYASWQGSSGSGSDILLNGDSAGLQASATFSLSAVAASVSPASAVINVGGSATFNLSLRSTNLVPGTVSLACGGVPSGVSCSFSPSSLTLDANGTASSALSVSVSLKPSASVAQHGPSSNFGPQPDATPTTAVWMWGIGLALFGTILIAKPLIARARRYNCADLARAFALTLLLAAAAAGMQSCAGGTQSGGGGGGGGGGSITLPLTLQARSNSASSNLQTITITVP
jgi:hypothetical protein